MSAIAGILRFDNETIGQFEYGSLLEALNAYPADESASWLEGNVLLACRHQWITPESRGEILPYYDQTRQLAIVASAILDNRDELFDQLKVKLAFRKVMSDTELILMAYERWGVDSPSYLAGDFAYMIWDMRERRLFGARDPLGTRTLYYTASADRIAFCSAIRPLLALPEVVAAVDDVWLSEYLAITSMLEVSDCNRTAYASIRQLAPAQAFICSADGKITINRYGSLLPSEPLRLHSDTEYESAFREVFFKAVRAKIRTHREVGATLSGGLDSGAVVGYAARQLEQKGKVLHTYSYVPPPDFVDWTTSAYMANEKPFIDATVKHVGNINEHFLDLADDSPFDEIEELLDIREMPYKTFENSFWVKEVYVRARQQGAGVLLTGAQGNHTISWGYAPDYYSLLLARLRWVKLYRELGKYSSRMSVRRSWLLKQVAKNALAPLLPGSGGGGSPSFPAMIHPAYAKRTGVYDRLNTGMAGGDPQLVSPWRTRQLHFSDPSVSNLIGTGAAKFALRYGLWERDPTADHRVIKYCLSLPVEQYVKNGQDRALIRRTTEGVLPDMVRLNQRYRGVQGVDWVHRMRQVWGGFLSEVEAIRKDSRMEGLLDTDQIKLSLAAIGTEPRPELALSIDARFLMRCLIVYRFLKRVS